MRFGRSGVDIVEEVSRVDVQPPNLCRDRRPDLSEELLSPRLGADATANVLRLRWDSVYSHGVHHWLVGGNLATAGGSDSLIAAYSALGGLANFSGYTENQIIATQTALARAVYYRRLTDSARLFSVPLYVGGSLEMGGAWNRREDIALGNMHGAASLFLGVDTFLGPLFLGYGHAQGGNNAFYLTFGSFLRTDP